MEEHRGPAQEPPQAEQPKPEPRENGEKGPSPRRSELEAQIASLGSRHDQLQFNDLFSTNRPQNVLAGASSGLKSIVKGTLCGVASLTVLPAVGYKQEGVQGAAKGLAAGVIGCFGLVGTGITIGGVQTVRGLANTPEAIQEYIKGKKRWDKSKRVWVVDNLEEEKKRLRETGESDDDIIGKARKRFEESEKEANARHGHEGTEKAVACREYYDVLGVEPHATDVQIKRAYYVKASKCHPDKCKAPEAKQQFQELSEAYQVLSDPGSRAKYDAEGKDAVNNGDNQMSPNVMYTTLFGSEAFEPYIGKLSFSLYFMSDVVLNREEMETLQLRRELRVAINLASLLRPFVDGHRTAFEDSARELALSLRSRSFGDRLLHVIGHEYKLNARHRLSLWDSSIAKVQGTTDNLLSYSKMATSGYNAYMSYKKAAERQGSDVRNGSHAEEEAVTSSLIDVAFEATYLDIAKTLANAIDKLLHDDIPNEDRDKRAKGLILLGDIFMDTARGDGQVPITNMDRLRSAFMPVQNREE
eukprot:TRINITY_DN1239_c0_g2_i1.p1 TRINITY_DN1239_c0_g2~~TRINITY_DN1239_c0_g2_i1.p1  ORF type:complete len:537 (+),score=98.22 TRINITY_DN1239_c0_g2_i1:28-1611(+)